MKKTNILITILIISLISGSYFFTNILNSRHKFEKDFKVFQTPSETKVELNNGIYELFELSTKLKENEKPAINYLVTEYGENPTIIEIDVDTMHVVPKIKTTITYAIFDKVYKSIGQFEIKEKQTVKIISKISDDSIDQLAYREKETSTSFFGMLKSSLLLLFSVAGFLISGILLLVYQKKK